MGGRRQRRRQLALLFDENLPPRVAKALYELEFRVFFVGDEKHHQPPRGTSDRDILDHVATRNLTIVTRNLDMVMLCATLGQSAVWIDSRGRQLREEEIVRIVFDQIERWGEAFAATKDPICVCALRTTMNVLTIEEAGTKAARRHHRLQARKRTRRAKRNDNNQLTMDGGDRSAS